MKTLLYIGTGLIAVLVIVFLSLPRPGGNQIVENTQAISSQTLVPSTPTPEHSNSNRVETALTQAANRGRRTAVGRRLRPGR